MNNKVKFLRGTSGEYAVVEKDSDTIYFTTDDGKLYIGDKGISGTGGLTIDDTLSDTSENPVQNKVVNAALSDAKSYTDTKIADLINGAPTTLDTLGEIAAAMSDNQSVVEALNSAIGSKANATDLTAHTDNTSNPHNVTKSQVGLGNVPNVATNDQTPSYTEATALAKLSSGEKLSVAFGKISKAITDFISHIGDTVKHITSTERTNWNAAKSHADSAHAPSNAQVNVIETVKVNGTALTPNSKAVDITVPSYSTMTGATSSAAGTSGLVPAPASGKQSSYLRGDGTWAVPTNTDTKVTNTLNTTAKAYVTGTTSSSTNTGTQVFDTGVYLDTTAGMLTATTFKGALSGNASTSTKLASSSCTTISIATSDWSTNSDGGYICTKTLSSAMAYTNFNFDVVLSTDQAAAKLQIEAWNCVIADGNITQTTSNGSTTAFTFYAFTTKPSVALTIAVQGVS